jgi:RNA polymerase sigma-70 factor (ECF subfamily)
LAPLALVATHGPGQAGTDRMSKREAAKLEFTQAIGAQIDGLYGLALRLVRNEADAQDLVAETVTKAWLAIDTLSDPDRFRPWVFRILRNQVISEYRKKTVRPQLVSMDEQKEDTDEDDVVSLLSRQPDDFLLWWADPETQVANELLGEQIRAAIEELPENFRETILLVTVDGLGYDEAAEVMGVPKGTIRSRMKRGRTLLQKALWTQARDAGLLRSQDRKK